MDTYSKKFHLTHLLQNRIATCKVIQQYLTTDQTVLFALVSNRKKSYYLQKQLYFYCLKFSKDRTVFNTGIRILDIIFCEIPCQTQIFWFCTSNSEKEMVNKGKKSRIAHWKRSHNSFFTESLTVEVSTVWRYILEIQTCRAS